jgi:hypothetical protein
MQATITLRIAALLASLFFWVGVGAQSTPSIRLAEPQITDRENGSVSYEIALRAPLPEGTTATLASPQIHQTKGFEYPLWLSDATMEVQQRTGQRPSLRIQARRSHAGDHSEIMLAFTSNNNTYFVPYVLPVASTLGTPRGAPLPPPPTEPYVLTNPQDAITNGIIRNPPVNPASPRPMAQHQPRTSAINNQHFATRSAASASANAPYSAAPQAAPSTRQSPPARTQAALLPHVTPNVPSAASPPSLSETTIPSAAASQPEPPLTAMSAPVAAPSTALPPPLPTPTPTPTPTAQQTMPALQANLMWAIGAVAALLLLYLLIRQWRNNRNKQRSQASVLARDTQFQPTDRSGAGNTVFGLSDSEAVAMQQQWQQQMLKKSKT